ncbi:MAG: hypothetical protein ACOCWA_01990 [Bacteroidota bacterium]
MKRIIIIITLMAAGGFIYTNMNLQAVENLQARENNSDKQVKIKELENYTSSLIKGKVIKIMDEDEFRLQDESGKIKVYTGWKNTNTVSPGETVSLKGYLDPGILKEFYASEIIRENGERILLEKD